MSNDMMLRDGSSLSGSRSCDVRLSGGVQCDSRPDGILTVFCCDNDFTSMLTCIYVAGKCRLGRANFRLCVEPVEQLGLFERYVHVDADDLKAAEVVRAISTRISSGFYSDVMYCSGAYEPDTLDTIYSVIALGFRYGPKVLDMFQFPEVARFFEISRRYGAEAHSFREFARFNHIGDALVAHIEPKSHVLLPVAEYFIDRCPSENWMVIDDVHRQAVVHPADSPYYIRFLTDEEFERLRETEDYEDEFSSLWRSYVDRIAIQARTNYRCQLNHFPKWKRKHATEFM